MIRFGSSRQAPVTEKEKWIRRLAETDWESTVSEALAKASVDDVLRSAGIFLDSCDGWRCFTGAGPWHRVLCFDNSLGGTATSVAKVCQEVTLIGTKDSHIRATAKRLHSKDITCRRSLLQPEPTTLPFPDSYFDAVVIDDLGALFAAKPGGRSPPSSRLLPFFSELHRVLNDRGVGYFGYLRLFSFEVLRQSMGRRGIDMSTAMPWTGRALHRLLERGGFHGVESYPAS